jgi:DNA topoisomerase-1
MLGSGLGSGLGSAVPNATKAKRLVIVESPAKAKTIAGYLGPQYVV